MSALFVRHDSVYKTLPDVDAWDEERDARSWPGGTPVVARGGASRWHRGGSEGASFGVETAIGGKGASLAPTIDV